MLIIGFSLFLQSYRAANEQHRLILVKTDNQLIGERIIINRKGKAPVKANIYYPTESDKTNLSIVFNIHGGGFVGGDADVLDTQSQRIANQWNSVIVSVNYTKADVKPIDYGTEEIKDAVVYFIKNAKQFGIDSSKVTVMGYSAGAYYTVTAVNMLNNDNTIVSNVVLAYPWMTGMDAQKLGDNYPQTLFVLAGKDQISQNAKLFIEDMKKIIKMLPLLSILRLCIALLSPIILKDLSVQQMIYRKSSIMSRKIWHAKRKMKFITGYYYHILNEPNFVSEFTQNKTVIKPFFIDAINSFKSVLKV